MNAVRWSVRDRVTGEVLNLAGPDRKDKKAQARFMDGLRVRSKLGSRGGCLHA
jgi:hypothetical protein